MNQKEKGKKLLQVKKKYKHIFIHKVMRPKEKSGRVGE